MTGTYGTKFISGPYCGKLLAGLGAILLGAAIFSQPLLSAYLLAAMVLWILGATVIVGGIVLILMLILVLVFRPSGLLGERVSERA